MAAMALPHRPSTGALLLNAAGFQLAWLACVSAGTRGLPVAAAVLAWALWQTPWPLQLLRLLLVCTLLGALVDGLLLGQGLLQLVPAAPPGPTPLPVAANALFAPVWALHWQPPPPWLLVLWPLFGSTLGVSLAWLQGRILSGAVLGAIGGLASYQAGVQLGAISMPDPSTARLLLALLWAMLVPALSALARRWCPGAVSVPSRDVVPGCSTLRP
jgi:hypothetical protein